MDDRAPQNLPEDQFRRQLATGNHAAFDLLITRYRVVLSRFVHSCIPCEPNEVDDIVQDAFIRFWKGRARLGGTGALYALLQDIARKTAIDHLRSRKLRSHSRIPADAVSSAPSPADVAYGRELEQRLLNATAELTQAQRTSLELKLAGLSAKEIAKQLGCSPKAVERRWDAARQHLRARLS